MCCSAVGEKLPPLVIGTAKKPRCFEKAFSPEDAGFTWRNNKTGWMTGAIFREWLADLNERFMKEDRKILMLLDNFPGHLVDSTSNIKLAFFPPNQTSKVQPLDLGIIKSYKDHEAAARAKHRRDNMDLYDNIKDYSKSVDVLQASKWIVKGWKKTKKRTMRNYFRKSGAYHMVENK